MSKKVLVFKEKKKIIFFFSLCLLLSLVFCGCANEKKMTRPPMPINIGKAVIKDAPFSIFSVGNVVAFNAVTIVPQVTGQLQVMHFKEGQFVNEGELLITIDPTMYKNQLEQATSLLEKETAQARFEEGEAERYAMLMKEGAISTSTYQNKMTNNKTQKAVLANYQEQKNNAAIKLGYCYIKSPISGKVGTYLVNKGNLVKENETQIVTINQMSPTYVQFTVPEKYLEEVRKFNQEKSLDVIVTSSQQKTDQSVKELRVGKLCFIDNAIDKNSGTVKMRGEFANTDSFLWPGEFVTVRLDLYLQKNAVIVPEAAVQLGQQGNYVFIVDEETMTVKMQNVKIDRNLGDGMIVVAEGLKGNETLVTDGQINLNDGSAVLIKDGK